MDVKEKAGLCIGGALLLLVAGLVTWVTKGSLGAGSAPTVSFVAATAPAPQLSPASQATQTAASADPPSSAPRQSTGSVTPTASTDSQASSEPAKPIPSNCHDNPAALADAILEAALTGDRATSSLPMIGRTGAWFSSAVSVVTTVVLLRLRFKLSMATSRSRLPFLTLAEEPETLAFAGGALADPAAPPVVAGDAARLLLATPANALLADVARDRHIVRAREFLDKTLHTTIAQLAIDRAALLQADHLRVREAARSTLPQVTVEPVLPPDIIGFFTLLPSLTEAR